MKDLPNKMRDAVRFLINAHLRREYAKPYGKPLPAFENEFSQFFSYGLAIVDYASRNHDFRQKDLIVLGIVARERRVRSIELTQMLGLSDGDRLANRTSRLIEQNLIVQHGLKKATAFHSLRN